MSGEDDDYTVEKNCNAEFGGLCQSSGKTDVATKFVKIFNRVIIDHNLKVGQLLVFSTSSDSVFAFMGVRMQRPMAHTLVRATVGHEDNIHVINWGQTQPVSLMTSHELFNQLDPSVGESVVVEVWSYTLEWNSDSNTDHDYLKIQLESKVKGFTLDPKTKLTTRKPRLKLPFGLEMKKKHRKKARQREGSAKSKTMRSRRLLDATTHSQQQNSGRDHDKNDLKGDGDEEDNASDSDSSTSSRTSDDDIVRGSEAPDETMEDVDVAGTSDTAKQEERDAKMLVDEHEIIRNEFQSTPEPAEPSSSSGMKRPQNSETCQAAKPSRRLEPKVQEPKGPGTFFSKECGLAEVGLAASNRSRCYFCQNLIAKGFARFSWHHSILKPPVWVHDGCLRHLVSRDGFKDQCKKRLEVLRRGVSSSDPPRVVNAIDSALTWA